MADIQATGRDVRRDQHLCGAFPEAAHNAITLVLG